jgi:hypothetical protein
METQKKSVNQIGSLIFVGCLFIGGGVGLAIGKVAIGGAIGMGIGFLAMAVVQMLYRGKAE